MEFSVSSLYNRVYALSRGTLYFDFFTSIRSEVNVPVLSSFAKKMYQGIVASLNFSFLTNELEPAVPTMIIVPIYFIK